MQLIYTSTKYNVDIVDVFQVKWKILFCAIDFNGSQMKPAAVPGKTIDIDNLAKENAKLSKDVIRMAIDLEDHRKQETR